MASERALLMIADIGGYTDYMGTHRMSLAHAEVNTGRLLEAVIDAAPNFELIEIEGDAAFLSRNANTLDRGGPVAAVTQAAAGRGGGAGGVGGPGPRHRFLRRDRGRRRRAPAAAGPLLAVARRADVRRGRSRPPIHAWPAPAAPRRGAVMSPRAGVPCLSFSSAMSSSWTRSSSSSRAVTARELREFWASRQVGGAVLLRVCC